MSDPSDYPKVNTEPRPKRDTWLKAILTILGLLLLYFLMSGGPFILWAAGFMDLFTAE